MPVTVLSVAEKPSVAREIAAVLGGGRQHRVSGVEPKCPIWAFDCPMAGHGMVNMRVTSVLGHLHSMDFTAQYK